MFIFLQKGKKMKKNIILLIVSILGVSKISAFGVNTTNLNCFLAILSSNQNISEGIKQCGQEANSILETYPSYDAFGLLKALMKDGGCRDYLTGQLLASNCGNLID